jgi:hypothetical protein
MSTLDRYNEAFEMLGQGWQTVPEVQRCALIGVAESSKEDFLEGSPLMSEIMPLFF